MGMKVPPPFFQLGYEASVSEVQDIENINLISHVVIVSIGYVRREIRSTSSEVTDISLTILEGVDSP